MVVSARSPNSLESPVHPFIILYIHSAEALSRAVAPPSEGSALTVTTRSCGDGGAVRAAAAASGRHERERARGGGVVKEETRKT